MKVLFAIDGLGGGGTERSLAELLPLIRERGVDPTVVCLKRAGGELEAEVAAGFDVRFLAAAGRAGRARELRRVLAGVRPHLLRTLLFEADLLGRLAAAGTSARVLTSLVNTTYDRSRLGDPRVSAAKLWAARQVDGWTARHLVDHFHAVSDRVRWAAVAALHIPPGSITVIERGRDGRRLGEPSPERRPAARAALGLSDSHEVVMNVGRQEFQKGLPHLVEAIGLLRERPRLLLLQAGREGQVSGELQRLTAGDDRIRLLGHREDIPELLAAADVFALPSLYGPRWDWRPAAAPAPEWEGSQRTVAAWLELQFWWRYAFGICADPSGPRAASAFGFPIRSAKLSSSLRPRAHRSGSTATSHLLTSASVFLSPVGSGPVHFASASIGTEWVVIVSSPPAMSASVTIDHASSPYLEVDESCQLGYASFGMRSSNGISCPASTGPSWSGSTAS